MSKSWMAAAVPDKGGSGRFNVDKCLEFIEENGDSNGDIVIKTDQESATECLIKSIMSVRGEGKTIPEESPKKSSGSNGVVERGV